MGKHLKGLFAESIDDFRRGRGADALYGTAGKVFEHLCHRGGHFSLTVLRAKLAAEGRMVVPMAGKFQLLSGRDLREDTHDRDELSVVRREVQYRKAGVLPPKGQFLRNAAQRLQFLLHPLFRLFLS